MTIERCPVSGEILSIDIRLWRLQVFYVELRHSDDCPLKGA